MDRALADLQRRVDDIECQLRDPVAMLAKKTTRASPTHPYFRSEVDHEIRLRMPTEEALKSQKA
jgi:hypothetical protein